VRRLVAALFTPEPTAAAGDKQDVDEESFGAFFVAWHGD
jgi:hypothetical protein